MLCLLHWPLQMPEGHPDLWYPPSSHTFEDTLSCLSVGFMDSRVLWLGSGESKCFQTREACIAVLQHLSVGTWVFWCLRMGLKACHGSCIVLEMSF